MKKILLIFSVFLFGVSLFAGGKKFDLPTVPGADNKCSQWKEGRYTVVSDGLELRKNRLCYNASVLPVNGAGKALLRFKYRGKATQCGLFYYSKNSGLRGRELVYLPNCEKMREFNGEFTIPQVIDKRKILGIRLVFLTTGQGVFSDSSVTLVK